MNNYVYDNLTIENTKELMEMLNFLLDNDMISITEYNWWEDNTTISLQLKSDLLTLALNDIENMLDDLYNNRDEDYDIRSKKARYVKYKGYGNSVNKWNSLVEIVFTEKK